MLQTFTKESLFHEYYAQWIKVYKEGAIRPVTLKKYLMTLEWLKKLAPNLKLCEMTRINYQQLINDYAETHERQTTMDFHHQIKCAILDAVDEGLIVRDPTRKAIIKGKTPREKKPKYLNQFELHTMLNHLNLTPQISWDWFILLVAKTGMRFSEALALTPKDFDFPHQTLSISKTWDYKHGTGFLPTKNRSSVRTITPYGKDIEPNVPPKEQVMQDFITLSQAVGIKCIGWRYDPIFIDGTYTLERHISDFETMCNTLSGYTRVCVISFIDIYEKVTRNFPQARTVTPQERIAIGKAFADIGQRYGITIKACAEGNDLAPYGVDCYGCMTQETFETAIGCSLDIPKKKSQRSECSCVLGTDIGAYDTCAHLCRYCYANSNRENVRRNIRLHDPNSPFLVGTHHDDEVIHQAEQVSWIDNQLSFF